MKREQREEIMMFMIYVLCAILSHSVAVSVMYSRALSECWIIWFGMKTFVPPANFILCVIFLSVCYIVLWSPERASFLCVMSCLLFSLCSALLALLRLLSLRFNLPFCTLFFCVFSFTLFHFSFLICALLALLSLFFSSGRLDMVFVLFIRSFSLWALSSRAYFGYIAAQQHGRREKRAKKKMIGACAAVFISRWISASLTGFHSLAANC